MGYRKRKSLPWANICWHHGHWHSGLLKLSLFLHPLTVGFRCWHFLVWAGEGHDSLGWLWPISFRNDTGGQKKLLPVTQLLTFTEPRGELDELMETNETKTCLPKVSSWVFRSYSYLVLFSLANQTGICICGHETCHSGKCAHLNTKGSNLELLLRAPLPQVPACVWAWGHWIQKMPQVLWH